MLRDVTNNFSAVTCQEIRREVEQSTSSLVDHPTYGPWIATLLGLNETLAEDATDGTDVLVTPQKSIEIRTMLALLFCPELKTQPLNGHNNSLQELIADAHDEPDNTNTAFILRRA